MNEVLDIGKSVVTVALGLFIGLGLGIMFLAIVLNLIKLLLF